MAAGFSPGVCCTFAKPRRWRSDSSTSPVSAVPTWAFFAEPRRDAMRDHAVPSAREAELESVSGDLAALPSAVLLQRPRLAGQRTASNRDGLSDGGQCARRDRRLERRPNLDERFPIWARKPWWSRANSRRTSSSPHSRSQPHPPGHPSHLSQHFLANGLNPTERQVQSDVGLGRVLVSVGRIPGGIRYW